MDCISLLCEKTSRRVASRRASCRAVPCRVMSWIMNVDASENAFGVLSVLSS